MDVLSSFGNWMDNFGNASDKFLSRSPKYTIPAIATLLGANYLGGGSYGAADASYGGSSASSFGLPGVGYQSSGIMGRGGMSTIPVGYRASLGGGSGITSTIPVGYRGSLSGGSMGMTGDSSGFLGGLNRAVSYLNSGSSQGAGSSWDSVGSGLEGFGGHLQDFGEGLAQLKTKDDSYRSALAERGAARRRQRLQDTLGPLEQMTKMIAAEPRLAKVYGPGGALDGTVQTQLALTRDALASNGLDPGLADQYGNVIKAVMQLPPEPVRAQSTIGGIQSDLNAGILTPDQASAGMQKETHIAEGNAQVDKKIGEYTTPGGDHVTIMQRPDNTTYESKAGSKERIPPGPAADKAGSVAQQKLDMAVAAAGLSNKPRNQWTPQDNQKVLDELRSIDPLNAFITSLLPGGGGAAPATPAAASPAAPVNGTPSGYKVGDTISVQGQDAVVTAVNPDGSLKIKTANGRTGTIVP